MPPKRKGRGSGGQNPAADQQQPNVQVQGRGRGRGQVVPKPLADPVPQPIALPIVQPVAAPTKPAWGKPPPPQVQPQQPTQVRAPPGLTPPQQSSPFPAIATQPSKPTAPPGFVQESSVPVKGKVSPVFQDVTKSLAQFQLAPRNVKEATLPKRPGFGVKGRKINLIANHFPIEIPDGSVFHYDVEIEHLKSLKPGEEIPIGEALRKAKPQQISGRRVPAMLTRQIIDKLQSAFKEFSPYLLAYDGNKNLYTRKPLPFNEPKHFIVLLKEEGRDLDSRFKVSIKPVEKEGTSDCEVSLEPLHAFFKGRCSTLPQEAITALDIILRTGPAKKMFPVRNSFFNIPRNPRDKHVLTGGHEIWFGYYQSLRPGQWKPLLNIDKSATTFFPAGPVLDFFCAFLKKYPEDIVKLSDVELKKLNKEMKNVQICVTHLPYRRKFRVYAVTKERASELSFIEDKAGVKKKITIEEYFKKSYKPLKNPHFPCLHVGVKEKKIYMPLEVCELVQGQHYRRKLTDIQTSEMIKFTATTPVDRFKAIQQSIQSLSEMSRNYLREYGIKISTEPLHLEGRVLDAPNVLYDEKKIIKPREGSWDMKGSRFFKGCVIKKWAVLSLSSPSYCRDDLIQKLCQMLCSIGHDMGAQMDKCTAVINKSREAQRLSTELILQQVYQQIPGLELLIVILGKFSNYAEIKSTADTKLGLMTQCLKDDSVVRKCNPQLICNVLQKINAKMGGVNSSLNVGEKPAVFSRPVIIIGADVSHPSPGQNKPSVAAAVGSIDSFPSRYACVVKVQKNRDEIQYRVESILELKDMVKNLLKAFYVNTRVKPEKIIFYRDGVSEGQFADVQENEIPQIRQACEELEKGYQPGLTFVVVQKRHHTRFMPEDSRDGVGKCKNVPPGTMVDRDVCSSADFDFFLCSHYGIQGTSRPAHYTAIWDENNFTADELHKLTYHLCHTYVRCTRSISIPAPVQYAHLAAFRARHHIDIVSDQNSSGSESSYGEDRPSEISSEIIKSVDVIGKVLGSMYFV